MCFLLLPFHFPFPFLSLCVSSVVSTSRSSSESALLIDSSFCGFLLLLDCFWIVCLAFSLGSFFGFLKLVCGLCLAAGCLCCSCGYSLQCPFSVGGAHFSWTSLCVVCASLKFSNWLFRSFFQSRNFFLLLFSIPSLRLESFFPFSSVIFACWCNTLSMVQSSVSFSSSSSSILESSVLPEYLRSTCLEAWESVFLVLSCPFSNLLGGFLMCDSQSMWD